MFISKKKYEFVLARYEQAALRADRAEGDLAELYRMASRNGGPYKCILECREAAQELAESGCEDLQLTSGRLAFIDCFLTKLIPVMTRRMSEHERGIWEAAVKDRPADIYAPSYRYHRPEEDAC